ncbi:DUF1641 domain-containing protein [Pseudomonas sp. NPDC087612]|uniref:DUF1641 domain-containing protein n=1 Tax=unclassified Pseudomonas TaxID=196821 RepID=UPI0005EAEF1D|nr:DUF1641 domain-containing protein [Pseudomonas sp. 2(2015)]KJK14985.1 hypothetical protein UB48_22945 [Pseudomonas sp. 2(2015)]
MDAIDSPAVVSANPGLDALVRKLQPLLDSGRLDNVVDLLSLSADLVDLLDAAMVEKLSGLFEEATALSWNLGNALRMASAQTRNQPTPSLYGLLLLLRDPHTRRGLALVLRVLNVIGRQD